MIMKDIFNVILGYAKISYHIIVVLPFIMLTLCVRFTAQFLVALTFALMGETRTARNSISDYFDHITH